jgi:hypothetical protein
MKPYERHVIRYAHQQREQARRARRSPPIFSFSDQLKWMLDPSKLPTSDELRKRFPDHVVVHDRDYAGTYGGTRPDGGLLFTAREAQDNLNRLRTQQLCRPVPLRRSWLTRAFAWLRPRHTPGASS